MPLCGWKIIWVNIAPAAAKEGQLV
jgi:hypothetical protein